MARRLLQVFLINRNCAEFTGPNAREVYKRFVGKAPVFNTRTRRWVSSPDRVRDMMADLEVRGWDVTVMGEPADVRDPGATMDPAPGQVVAQSFEQGLW